MRSCRRRFDHQACLIPQRRVQRLRHRDQAIVRQVRVSMRHWASLPATDDEAYTRTFSRRVDEIAVFTKRSLRGTQTSLVPLDTSNEARRMIVPVLRLLCCGRHLPCAAPTPQHRGIDRGARAVYWLPAVHALSG